MNPFDPSTDAIGLAQLNEPLARELQDVIAHMNNATNHVTLEDREKWDSKLDVATGATATETENGLMSAVDKQKMNSISYNANFYQHPKSGIIPGTYNSVKVDEFGHIIEAGNVTSIGDAQSLGGIDASEYARLLSPIFRGIPEMINTPNEEDYNALANVRFVRQYVDNAAFATYGFTETDVQSWNNKWDATNAPLATESNSGIMSADDKRLLNTLDYIARNVTETDIENWNNKLTYETTDVATQTNKGFMSAKDKTFLDSLSFLKNITNEDINRWNNKLDVETGTVATEDNNGLMSAQQVQVLNTLIGRTEITNEMIARWNNKLDVETGTVATTVQNGLMSADDKRVIVKLNQGVALGITQSDIDTWNNKQERLDIATRIRNGLMSSNDKVKLDNLTTASSLNDDSMAEIRDLLSQLSPATSETNGLMSSVDKVNLDTLVNARQNEATVTKEDQDFWNQVCNQYVNDYHVNTNDVNKWNALANDGATKNYVDTQDNLRVLRSDIFDSGFFKTKVALPNNGNAMITLNNEYGRFSLYDAEKRFESINGINAFTSNSEVGPTMFMSNLQTNTGNGINVSTSGVFYIKNSMNKYDTPYNREIAVKEDVNDLQNQINEAVEEADKIKDNIVENYVHKTQLDNYTERSEIFDGTIFTQEHRDSLYRSEIYNDNSALGFHFWDRSKNIYSSFAITETTEENYSDMQLYSIDAETNIGTRVFVNNILGMYYTKDTTSGEYNPNREVAVIGDIKSSKFDTDTKIANLDQKFVNSIGTLDQIVVSRMSDLDDKYVTALNANDSKFAEGLNDIDAKYANNLTATNDRVTDITSKLITSVNSKLSDNDALIQSVDRKFVTLINGIERKYTGLVTNLLNIIREIKNNMEDPLGEDTEQTFSEILNSFEEVKNETTLVNTKINNDTENIYAEVSDISADEKLDLTNTEKAEELGNIVIDITYSQPVPEVDDPEIVNPSVIDKYPTHFTVEDPEPEPTGPVIPDSPYYTQDEEEYDPMNPLKIRSDYPWYVEGEEEYDPENPYQVRSDYVITYEIPDSPYYTQDEEEYDPMNPLKIRSDYPYYIEQENQYDPENPYKIRTGYVILPNTEPEEPVDEPEEPEIDPNTEPEVDPDINNTDEPTEP